jgi:hypothetical protein
MGIAHDATRFPLRGAHIGAACEDCHTPASPGQLQFVNRSTTCEGCHAAQARTVNEPNHQGPGFANCSACHTVIAWTGARFDHSVTAFPLTGAHRAVSCDGCHGDQVFKGKTTQCVGCHQTDYDNTQAPPHASSGFATTCATCHTTTGWTGSAFNHAATQFPLTGAHVAQPCTACHGDGVYRGKPTDCFSCHQGEYTATTTPNHSAAQFPTACASCHTTTAWQGATFNHDAPYFPIYSGEHRGKWSTCAQCHTNPSNYQVFTCLTCHEHNQTDMDAKHANRAGYRYESQSCYACHPRGD